MPVQDDNSNDKRTAESQTRSSPTDSGDPATTINRLERALERDSHSVDNVRDDLQRLRGEVAQLYARFQEQLNEATAHRREAEARLADQSARLSALGAGREATMRELQETRAELARVAAERDRLQKDVVSLSSMQTETVALPDEEDVATGVPEVLPTLDELMANWHEMEQAGDGHGDGFQRSAESVDLDEPIDPLDAEMIAPELVFRPEDFDDGDAADAAAWSLHSTSDPSQASHANDASPGTAAGNRTDATGSSSAPGPAGNSRVLVFLDAEPPIKFPLYKAVITIGRSDIADVQVDSDFISRIHARVFTTNGDVVVEDAGSKNGIAVNDKHVRRQALRHGDVLRVGKAHFTFVDTAPGTD